MEDQTQIQLTVLSLQYEHQVARAQSIFCSFWEIFFGILVGFLGMSFGLLKLGAVALSNFLFILAVTLLLIILAVAGITAFCQIFISRAEREKIVKEIKGLCISQPHQP